MTEVFRESEFIDFNTGIVKVPPMWLQRSIQYLNPPVQLKDKICLFHCRVDVWQLGVAVQMVKKIESQSSETSIWFHSAYGMLSIIFSYFEMIGKTMNPNSKKSRTASDDFNFGFCDVYPEYLTASGSRKDVDMPIVREFRDRVRNGMYHLSYTKNGLLIHNNPEKISKKDFDVIQRGGSNVYYVNPHSMVRTIVAHFPGFIDRLYSPDSQYDGMRRKFEEFFDKFHRVDR